MSNTDPDPTVQWAREHGRHFRYVTALDNYEPVPRNTAYGDGWYYTTEDGDTSVILGDVSSLNHATTSAGRASFSASRCGYLLDDERTVVPYYVAGWHPQGKHVILRPLPTSFNADGTPKLRTDHQPVDFSDWMLGPRRTYHLKVTIDQEEES